MRETKTEDHVDVVDTMPKEVGAAPGLELELPDLELGPEVAAAADEPPKLFLLEHFCPFCGRGTCYAHSAGSQDQADAVTNTIAGGPQVACKMCGGHSDRACCEWEWAEQLCSPEEAARLFPGALNAAEVAAEQWTSVFD